MCTAEAKQRRKDWLITHYGMTLLPLENTYLAERERSLYKDPEGRGLFSTIFGLYCREPLSHSCFHRLCYEEVWLHLEGDPLTLYLLETEGSVRRITLGQEEKEGQLRQFLVPRGCWQGGCLTEGGEYALYQCTVVPAFTPDSFEAGERGDLIRRYPQYEKLITRLTPDEGGRFLPA